MSKYKLELKPVITYGIDVLPADRLQFIGIMLGALAEMIKMVEGVKTATLTDQYNLIIEGDDNLSETLSKFHEQAIITKLE